MRIHSFLLSTWCLGVLAVQALAAPLQFQITNPAGDPLPCRIHLYNAEGKPLFTKGLPAWRDHFVCNGNAKLDLPTGQFRYEIERGPEHETLAGAVDLKAGGTSLKLPLKRIADLAKAGWYSGDLHIHRPLKDIPLLIRAEDLHIAPVITWWNNRNLWRDKPIPENILGELPGPRFIHAMAGEDEREGGALLYFHLSQPLAITGASREHPSPMKFLAASQKHPGAWVDIEKPFWWDVPLWLASGQCDSIGLANNHMCRSSVYASEAWGRPRDIKRLPAPLGNGYWTQEIYYHLLNCGLRLPPSAGSASGVLPNPVGYNRVYVNMDGALTWKKWWQGLKAGRSFVTNGPLLRVRVNNEWPGALFKMDDVGLPVRFEIELTTKDRVRAIEVIHNGVVVKKIPCENKLHQKLEAEWKAKDDGWFLLRAITDKANTFRFASTAPFYLETGKPRISRRSAKFFLDWVKERQTRVPVKLTNAAQLLEVMFHHRAAQKFWEEKLLQANSD